MSNARTSELWVGGEYVARSSGKYFDDLKPLDHSLYSRVAEATTVDMDKAVQVVHAGMGELHNMETFVGPRGLLGP